jgi:DNA-directed RNA polymerase specialized sigma24 family protein
MRGFQDDRAKGKFKTWHFTTVRDTISTHYRKQSRRPITAAQTELIAESWPLGFRLMFSPQQEVLASKI